MKAGTYAGRLISRYRTGGRQAGRSVTFCVVSLVGSLEVW